MGDLTIRGIDDDLRQRLEMRAARNGRSLDEDLREALERLAATEDVGPSEGKGKPQDERFRRIQRMIALGRPSDHPFDLKAFSDALSDGSE